MMRTREDGATIKEDFDDLIVVCVGSQDLAYSLLFLLLVLLDVVDNEDDVDNVDDDDKGRIPLPNRMNFLKKSKWPLTPPPYFWKIISQLFL